MNPGFWKSNSLAFWAYSHKKLKLSYPPLFFSIELTNRCNLKCVYCPQACLTGTNMKKGDMQPDLFGTVIGKVAATNPVNQISLTGNGEPLLHPRLDEFIRSTCEHGLHPSFVSNGCLLDSQRFASLAAAGSFSLTIDFSPYRALYERNRVGSNWEEVYQNIRNALQFKKERNRKDIKVIIKDMSTIILQDDRSRQESLLELKKLFADLPVDQFTHVVFHNWIGNINRKVIPPFDDTQGYTICSHPWSLMQISFEGEIVGCCRDMGSEYVAGKINSKTDIMEVWNSPKMIYLRKALAQKRVSDIATCRNCDRPWRGGSIGKGRLDMIKNFLVRRKTFAQNQL